MSSKNSLQVEISQSPEDLLEHVWFQPVVENGAILFRLDLLPDINTTLDDQISKAFGSFPSEMLKSQLLQARI